MYEKYDAIGPLPTADHFLAARSGHGASWLTPGHAPILDPEIFRVAFYVRAGLPISPLSFSGLKFCIFGQACQGDPTVHFWRCTQNGKALVHQLMHQTFLQSCMLPFSHLVSSRIEIQQASPEIPTDQRPAAVRGQRVSACLGIVRRSHNT